MDYTYNRYSGVHALLVTPYLPDLSIDYDTFERYVRWQAANKPQYLFAVCGSSEMARLLPEERLRLAALAVENAQGLPVLTTANLEPDFDAQAEDIKRLEQTGVSGFVFTTKGYGDNPEKMYDYQMSLAAKTKLPIFLYEYPGFKPHLMDAETYGKLVKSGRFAGIKDTTCTMEGVKAKIAVQGDSSVLNANVPLLFDSYLAGGRGVMATTTTCAAQLFVRQWNAVLKGDFTEAERLHEVVCMVDAALGDGFPCSAKYFLSLQGVPMRYETRDGRTLSESRRRALEGVFAYCRHNDIL